MQKKISKKKLMYDIIKFVAATAIFYFGLTLNVFHIGEKTDIFDEDYILEKIDSSDLEDELMDVLGKHDAANEIESEVVDQTEDLEGERNEYKMKYQRICVSNMSICSKIQFDDEVSYKDKYMYIASTIYLVNQINDNIEFGRDVIKQLDKVTIKSEYGGRRGYATRDDIIINLGTVGSYKEFFELMSHELGHIIDLGVVRGFKSQKDSYYTEFDRKVFSIDDPSIDFYKLSWDSEKIRKSSAKKEDFCSGYGMTDPFEDFAECHNLYFNHNAIFRSWARKNSIMKKKYNFLANLYGGKYLFNASEDLQGHGSNDEWRPWDTTRM
ncbi:MAG TPA: hypothetical protein P5060_03580 [Candidatus Absconditabacterales bacterium]|nr:hypothetical protein [Candidatus Absconditabacterales bacterium]